MVDTYVECLVATKPNSNAVIIKSGMAALGALTFFAAVLINPAFFLLTILIGTAAYFWVIPNLSIEYEYTYLGDTIQIDKILNKTKRKRMAEIDMANVEICALKNSSDMRPFIGNKEYKVADYSSKYENHAIYGLVSVINGEKSSKDLIFFEPNDKLLKAMKYTAPRKIITE